MIETAISAAAALAGTECASALLVRWLRQKCPWLITASDRNPSIDADGLRRFIDHGWDADLGWIRKANTSHQEQGANGQVTHYSIGADGARDNPGFGDRPALGLAFGDSYTFSRQVNDDETWPHLLSCQLDINVANFGVGNYGIDQALLRFQRERYSQKPRFALMGVVPETICRILSQWKHFSEYGNTFAFKPRFFLENDGSLKLSLNPVDSIDKFYSIEKILPSLMGNDYFYERKFKKDLIYFPYTWSIFRTAKRTLPLMAAALLDRANPGKSRAFKQVMRRNIAITAALYKDHDTCALLRAICLRFAAASRAAGAEPVLVMLPQLYDLHRVMENDAFYAPFLQGLSNDMMVIDAAPPLLAEIENQPLYINDSYGGHLSPAGNRIVANHLAMALGPILRNRDGVTM